MSEKKITVGAKISAELDQRIKTEAIRLRLDRSEYVRRAIEEKIAGRDATAEALDDLVLKVTSLSDAVSVLLESQRKITLALAGGKK